MLFNLKFMVSNYFLTKYLTEFFLKVYFVNDLSVFSHDCPLFCCRMLQDETSQILKQQRQF